MKFCTECGTKAEFDAQKFCKVCGHKFPEMPAEPVQPESDETVTLLPDAAPAEDATESVFASPAVPKETAPAADMLEATESVFASPAVPKEAVSAADMLDATLGTQPPLPQQNEEAPAEDATAFVPWIQPGTAADAAVPEEPQDSASAAEEVHAQSFFETEPQYDYEDEPQPSAGNMVPPVPPLPEQPQPAPAGRKKGGPKVLLLIAAVLLLVAALAAGGFFAWKKLAESRKVTIGGTSYSIAETTSLTMEDPTEEDWTKLSKLTGLTSLTVTGNTELDEEKLGTLAQLEKLEELSIDGMQYPDGLAALSGMDALDRLALTNGQLTSEQCSGLAWPASLRELDLSGNALTELSFLQSCTGLKELDLSNNQILDYTPLTALTSLEVLSVDQCQAEPMSQLPALGTLTVGGKAIKDPVKYLADQKSAVELYNSMIGWFTSGDFDTLKVVLQQYGDAGALGDAALSYVNGWLMDAGAQWDHIRASLPADAKEVVMDETGIYYGQLVDGKRSGDGVQLFAGNYSVYTGAWANDLPNGTGTYRKTTADGTTLEFAGNYTDGYEDGEMTFTATNATGSQTAAYTAAKGTRTTVKKISDTQYAFAQFDTVYWYDAAPDGHGVAVADIPYQEEMAVQILPVASTPSKSSSSGKKNSGSSKKSSSPSSAPSTPSSDSSAPQVTAEDVVRSIIQSAQAAKEIYDTFQGIFNP